MRAQQFDQALADQSGDDGVVGRHRQWQAEVDQPVDDGHGAVGMHGGPDLMPGHGCAQCALGRGTVADFTDHDGVGVEPHRVRDRRREQARAFDFAGGIGDGGLDGTGDRIFDRVFDCQYMHLALRLDQLAAQDPLQRRRLAGAGRAADDVHADRMVFQHLDQARMRLGESERTQVDVVAGIVV